MKKLAVVAAVAIGVSSGMTAHAAVEQGMNEVSLLGDIHSISERDHTRETFSLAATYNRYLMDNLSVGADLKYVSADTRDESEYEDLAVGYAMVRSDYCFGAENDVVPYVGLRLGMASYEMGQDSWTAFAYGGQGGIKWFVAESLSINVELSYTAFTLSDTGAEDEVADDLGVQIGASLFFF